MNDNVENENGKVGKFDNKLDCKRLRSAIVRWVLSTDGYDGALGVIYEALPWDAEMQQYLEWTEVEQTFNDAIPCVSTGKGLLEKAIENNEFVVFNEWVDSIVTSLSKAYENAISTLNSTVDRINSEKSANCENNEVEMTNIIFESLKPLMFLELDFGDDGNNLFITDNTNGNEYELTVKKL